MEIERIVAAQSADKVLAAWAAAIEALDADAPASGEPMSAPAAGVAPHAEAAATHDPSLPASEPARPGMDSDAGHEAATVQTAWRPPTPAADAPRGHDAMPAATPAAQAGLAVPAALLVPATLTGLQVEPATHWPLPHPAAPDWAPYATPVDRRREPTPTPHDDRRRRHQAEAEAQPSPPARKTASDEGTPTPDAVLDATTDADWCDTLSAALRAALGARIAPQALLAAAEQWQRGRCVVLACPQGNDPAGPAWAFVLWPRPTARQAAESALALFGLRVDARLHWHTQPPTTPWCHVRVVKEHHPRRGRQLVSPDVDAAPDDHSLPCEVQLGPVLARSQRWCEVRVHIQAAQRFWAALGRQWSVHVVVSARPLLAAHATPAKANTPC